MNWKHLLSQTRPDESLSRTSSDQVRSIFEQDYDRIIFSYPFRILQDKTQVFPLPKKDFVHNRLTHSLEVSSVGRSLGKKAGSILLQRHPELSESISGEAIGMIVAAACLSHDIGNPPFGHSGEEGISDFFKNTPNGNFFKSLVDEKEWQDLTHFEGNAQGFRLLNKKMQGLKLTSATLATFSKYPREAGLENPDKSRRSLKKFGFFQSEKELFQQVADNCGLTRPEPGSLYWRRHPLAFLVEAADDICYLLIDLEDGTNLGLVDFKITESLLAEILGNRYQPEKLERYTSLREKTSLLRAMSIGILIEQATEMFLDQEAAILNGSFDRALTDEIPAAAAMKTISRISVEKIYHSRLVTEREVAGFEVLEGLLQAFGGTLRRLIFEQNSSKKEEAIFRLIPEEIRVQLKTEQIGAYEKIRLLLDFISGLTDSMALDIYRRIKGISLPEAG